MSNKKNDTQATEPAPQATPDTPNANGAITPPVVEILPTEATMQTAEVAIDAEKLSGAFAKLAPDPESPQQAEPNTELSAAEHRAAMAEAKVEALKLGATPQAVDDVISLAIARASGVKEPDYPSLISEVKSKYPEMFKAPDAESSGNKGTGGKIPTSSAGGVSEKGSIGRRLAKGLNTPTKQTFWR